MDKEPQSPQIPTSESTHEDPLAGIFFEIDTIMNSQEGRCVELFKPFTTRTQGETELFSTVEVWLGQGLDEQAYDCKLNYNTFDAYDPLKSNFTILDDTNMFPGLSEHIASFVHNKTVSEKQRKNFEEKLEARFTSFFSMCWKKAGGSDAKTPTYLSFENQEGTYIDMQTGERYTDEQLEAHLKKNTTH